MEADVSGERALEDVPLWTDLNVVRQGTFGERVVVDRNMLVVLDSQNGVLFTVDGANKEMKMVGGGSLLAQGRLVAVNGGRAVVMATAGLVELSLSTKTSALLKEADAEWGEVVEIGLFAGNVYLLDRTGDAVWQYPGLESGVGAKRRWLSQQTEIDLDGVVDMAIDGDVWMVYGSGRVERYRRGEKVAFTVSGLAEPLKQVTQMYTHEDLDAIYLLDRGNSRVVVISKEGAFLRQYTWQGLAAAQDIAVLPQEKVLVVLSGASLYRIPLE
jgi:hypothetical protein